MKISVVIPSYKPKSYIFDCLTSFKNQTLEQKDFEIILVLNGCDEPYHKILHEFILKNAMDNVVLVQIDLSGVSLARNLAIDIAKGEYIAFVDDDDYVSRTYLKELYDSATQGITPICKVVAFEDNSGTVVENYKLTELFESVKAYDTVPIMKARTYLSIPVAKIIDRNIIGKRRFNQKLKNGEDSLLMLELTDLIKELKPSKGSAIYYRRLREGSATRTRRSFKDQFICAFILLGGYLKCLLQPWRYNPLFVMTRILALFIYFFRSSS